MASLKIAQNLSATLILALSFATTSAWCCTGMQVKVKDGSFVNGHTVEFNLNLEVGGVVVPRNYEFEGTLPDGSPGLVYTSKYAAVGAGMFGAAVIASGINEKG